MTIEDPIEIDVSEHGESIAPSDGASTHELTVLTHDPTAQIVVLDEGFKPVEAAAGSLTAQLPAGIYKIRVRRGASSIGFEDRLVVLDGDRSLSIEPPELTSPAPIGGTRTAEAHVAAREWLDAVVHVNTGKGSKVAVLARYADPSLDGKEPHPFHGLQLLRADGRLLVDLEKAAPKPHVPDNKEAISICGIGVAPGAYILRHKLAHERDLGQSIIASDGWQTTVNIRRTQGDVHAKSKLFAGAGYLSLLMHRLIDDQAAQPSVMRNSKDGPIDEDQLVDIARQGLADGAQLLDGNLYDLLLRDFENPFAGILGALLLDLERAAKGKDFAPEHAKRFDAAVGKLRTMVGPGHPDVEALSFRCQDPGLACRKPIAARPMFHRCWRIILEAASSRRDLVPFDLWSNTSASGSMPPYLVWSLRARAKQARLKHLKEAAASLAAERIVPAAAADAGAEAPAAPALRGLVRRAASPTPKPRTEKLSQAEIALEVGVPANVLSHLIGLTKSAAKTSRHVTKAAKAGAKSASAGKGASAKRRAAGKSAGSAGRTGATRRKSGRTRGVSSPGKPRRG